MTETRAPRVCPVGPEPTVCEVLKATPGLPDLRAVTAAWGRLARWVQLGHQVIEDQQVLEEHLVRWDPEAELAIQDQRAEEVH